MKKYWLYLESYTMLFPTKKAILVYNTISGDHFRINSKDFLLKIINELQDKKNGYCIEISESMRNSKEIADFIRLMRECFCGDIIDQEFTSMKPFSLHPSFSIINRRERIIENNSISIGEKILNYLHYMTLQITGKCSLQCDHCLSFFCQVMTCTSSSYELDPSVIENLLFQLSGSSLKSIDIIGGNPLQYSKWELLLDILKQNKFSYNWYIDYRFIINSYLKIKDILSFNSHINIIVKEDFNEIILEKICTIIDEEHISIYFLIASEDQYRKAILFSEKQLIKDYMLFPIYTFSNESFFKEFVYVDEESIVSSLISKKRIMSNMNINKMNFGKITILANGEAYSNMNYPTLGNIEEDSIYELLIHEIKEGESWFRIRDQKPCTDCIYQWLCPSPSNYEFVIGKPNLCHVEL
jgi:pseudo-rSAM protein